jgi:hypothetical protein
MAPILVVVHDVGDQERLDNEDSQGVGGKVPTFAVAGYDVRPGFSCFSEPEA